MAEPARSKDPLETLALAGVGALVLAAGRIDELADEIASRVGVDPSDVKEALRDAIGSWGREARRVREGAGDAAERVAEEIGVSTRETVERLELRIAQLEHRLRLLERENIPD
jgi:polyhydroxyalkanoate synthesis regulator phasin